MKYAKIRKMVLKVLAEIGIEPAPAKPATAAKKAAVKKKAITRKV